MNEVANLLHEFVTDLGRQIAGVPNKESLIQSFRPAQERFRREIRSTAPQFRPYEKKFALSWEMPRATFLDHESDMSENKDDIGKQKECIVFVDEVFYRAQWCGIMCLYTICGWSPIFQLSYSWAAWELSICCSAILHKWVCWKVAGACSVPLQKHVQHALSSLKTDNSWTFCALRSRDVRASNSVYLLSGWIPTVLIAIHSILMQDHLKSCFARTEQRIDWLVDLEDTPFSLNTHYLSDYKSKFLTFYRGVRNKGNHKDVMSQIDTYTSPKNSSSSYGISKVMSGLAEIGLIGVQARDLAKLFKIDDMEPALEIMADVRAYFQGASFGCEILWNPLTPVLVACKRFSDNIPMAIDRELVYGVERDALALLRNGLGLNSIDAHQICKEFAQESPSIASKREELAKKLERLEEASKQLLQVGGGWWILQETVYILSFLLSAILVICHLVSQNVVRQFLSWMSLSNYWWTLTLRPSWAMTWTWREYLLYRWYKLLTKYLAIGWITSASEFLTTDRFITDAWYVKSFFAKISDRNCEPESSNRTVARNPLENGRRLSRTTHS